MVALCSLLLLFMVVQLLKLGEVTFGAGLSAADLSWIALSFLPMFAVWILPVSVLAGILMGFARMVEDGELVALAAAGCSRLRLATMPLLLGGMASILALILSAWLAPSAADGLHHSLVRLAKQHVVASLQAGRFFEEIPKVVIYPRASDGPAGHFRGLMIDDRRPGKPKRLLLAKHAEVMPDAGGQGLVLRLSDGEVHVRAKRGQYTHLRFARAEMGLNIERLIHDRTRSLPALDRLNLQQLALRASEASGETGRRLASAWHRRIAFPMASIVFAWLALFLGLSGRLQTRRGTLLVSVAVVLSYYLLMRLGDGLVKPGWISPCIAAWLPNGLLLGLLALAGLWGKRGRA
ncbi:MAG: LptF/LptG family permease [Deltaproteobacteria bacterium]|nr:LptF/LptG family permease [Deltaproteobacteria bacterium]